MQELERRLGRLFAVLCMVSVFPALFPGVFVGDITQLLALQSDLKEVPWKLDFCYGCPWGFLSMLSLANTYIQEFSIFFSPLFHYNHYFFFCAWTYILGISSIIYSRFFLSPEIYIYASFQRSMSAEILSCSILSLVYFTCSLISRQAVSIYMPLCSV